MALDKYSIVSTNAPPVLENRLTHPLSYLQKLLNFEDLPSWSSAFLRNVKVVDTKSVPATLPEGQMQDGPSIGTRLAVETAAMSFSPSVVVGALYCVSLIATSLTH